MTGRPFEAMLIFGIIQALGGVFLMLIPIVQKLTVLPQDTMINGQLHLHHKHLTQKDYLHGSTLTL